MAQAIAPLRGACLFIEEGVMKGKGLKVVSKGLNPAAAGPDNPCCIAGYLFYVW